MAESRPTVRILVVDDAIEVCELASLILRRAGYETSAAATASEALAAFGTFKPDLVLLDIVLPDLSGFEVCKRIRVLDAEGACPVVVMSSLASGFDKSTAFDAGAADYVEKPLDHDELLARVRAQLSLAAQRGEERRNARELERLVRERTAELGRRLEERTQLIKEIHHRVMNNLQVIRSLAVRQADAVLGSEARQALLSIEARLGAMASVYRSIFDSSDDLSSIDGAVLLASIVHAAALAENAAEFAEDQLAAGPCVLTLTRAVPFALIAHELSTCAFRTGGRGGKGLRVSLETADGMHVLRFALAAENRRSGHADCLDLATMLAPQLGGTLSLAAEAWTLRFPA